MTCQFKVIFATLFSTILRLDNLYTVSFLWCAWLLNIFLFYSDNYAVHLTPNPNLHNVHIFLRGKKKTEERFLLEQIIPSL